MKVIEVILVDNCDKQVGTAGKMEAHEKGLMHRAFSVFIFNNQGEMLLQQRAIEKYHSGGLWTNACCSHPLPGEETKDAAKRRLREELGFEVSIEKIFDFSYNTVFDNGLTENEFDHVYAGRYEGAINFNKAEVMDICYKNIDKIISSLKSHPEEYTAWFHIAFPKIEEWWRKNIERQIA